MKRLLQVLVALAVVGGLAAALQRRRQLPAPDEGIWKPAGPVTAGDR
jgi:hypothetical protein